jgi:ubiquinone/menaquinone biosynthesis C-methylase UbiE
MGNRHDYLPAAGRDFLLPAYDLLGRLLGISKVHQSLIEQAEIAAGLQVLEVGCGTGNLSIRAKIDQSTADLIGCDPDPRALARAQRKARGLTGVRFDRAYVQNLPYADGDFDRVLSSLMWHHLDEGVKTAAAAEIFRVLRPGGSLHLVDVAEDRSGHDGLGTRLTFHKRHAASTICESIPRTLAGAGFDCTEIASRSQRIVGRLTFYRAVRP